jgi:hypothetical protein
MQKGLENTQSIYHMAEHQSFAASSSSLPFSVQIKEVVSQKLEGGKVNFILFL